MTSRASEATVGLQVADGVARITFSHPGKRNAFTWAMYSQLSHHLETLAGDPAVRAVLFRGTPEDGFAAGTDIGQFTEFLSGDDGVDYERRVGAVLQLIGDLDVPVIALVEGFAVGAGLAIAACSDVVLAERGALFGVPIARTIGNCLPVPVMARLRARIGHPLTDVMLLTATLIPAEDLTGSGFVFRVVPPGGLEAAAQELLRRVTTEAPLTLRAVKETNRRLDGAPSLPDTDDLLRLCYGSDDFHEGVAAFLARRHPTWTGH